jgi:hypothetical protein
MSFALDQLTSFKLSQRGTELERIKGIMQYSGSEVGWKAISVVEVLFWI